MANSARQNAVPPAPHQPHVVIEIADQALNAVDKGENALKGVRLVSGFEAFRQYDWLAKPGGAALRGVPLLNKAGNLRGMVINKNARVIFNYSTNALEKLDKYSNALLLAGLAVELLKDKDKIAAIAASNQPGNVKASKYCLIGSMAIIRAIGGIVPGGAHVLAKSIEGYLDIADLATGHSPTTQKMLSGLRAADARVTTVFDQVTDPDNAYDFINTYLVL